MRFNKDQLRSHCARNVSWIEAKTCYQIFISKNVHTKSIKNYKLIRKRTIERSSIEGLNRNCVENIEKANEYRKRCSTLLVTRELHIKTTVRYHCTPTRMIKISKSENSVDKGLAQ